jgi:hypothetical protein
MKFSSLRFLAIPLAAVLLAPISAAATTIDFSTVGAPGDTGSSTFVDPGTGLTVTGFHKDDADWLAANLYIRDQTNDHGFGICNPTEAPCPGPSGGGDINELDNDGAQELIRLALPAGYEWESVQLSSLDDNDDGKPDLEFGQLWADMDGNPDTLDTVLWQFMGDSANVEPSFLIPGSAASSPYLFFQPFDWTPGGLNINNDFLVYGATINQTRVPEPATIGILGIGLLALGRLRRKR